MKRNNLFKLGLFTVFVAILSLTLVSGTFAKYTSTVTGSDTVKVAKWEWKINDTNLVTGDEGNKTFATNFTFDLFDTIKDTDGNNEADVANGLIAPGTQGSFEFTITNSSEVNGTYKLEFTSNEEVAQIQYSIDGTTWKDTIADLTTTDIELDMNSSITIKVQWTWAFDGNDTNDTNDTNLGLNPVVHQVKAKIVFTQVD